MISTCKQAEYALVQKIAAYTKIPRKTFIKNYVRSESDEETPVGDYPVLDNTNLGSTLFYSCVYAGKVNLMEFTDPRLFEKSEIKKHYDLGLSYVSNQPRSNYAMSLYLKGIVWIVREGLDLLTSDRSGGMFVALTRREAYTIQPVKLYLQEVLGAMPED